MPFQSRALGALKCGEQEHPFPSEVSAKATRPHSDGFDGISSPNKFIPETLPRPGRTFADGRRILSDDVTWLKPVDDSQELASETCDFAAPPTSGGVAVVLARVSADEDVRVSVALIAKLADADAFTFSELNTASWAVNKSIVILRVAVVDAARELCHVGILRNIRPMLRQHFAAVLVNLNLKHATESGPLKAQVQATYTREQAPEL